MQKENTNKSPLEIMEECFKELPQSDTRANIGPKIFITSLILTFLRDRGQQTIASLRRNVIKETKTTISRSSFWERLATKRLLKLLNLLVTLLMQRMIISQSTITEAILTHLGVTGILLLDSVSTSLPTNAKDKFPGSRKNVAPAVIKWHLCIDLLSGLVNWFALTPGKTHDRKKVPLIETIKGKLIIYDLGYYDYGLMYVISQVAYFLSRVKSNADIKIIKVITGIPKKYIGHKLSSLKHSKPKKIIEVLGEVVCSDGLLFQARVVGFWNPIDKAYHYYITNLKVAAILIYPLYRLRWQIELIFKASKTSFALKDMPSSNENIIQSMVLLTITASLIAYPLAKSEMTNLEDEKQMHFSYQRAATFLIQISGELIDFILNRCRKTVEALQDVIKLFVNELFDPNYKNRESSLRRVMRLALIEDV